MKLIVPFVIKNPQEEQADQAKRKKLFAEQLLKDPSDPFKVALSIFGSDTGGALLAAQEWPSDFEVIEYQQQLIKEQGELAFLPSIKEALRLAYDIASGKVTATAEMIKGLDIYMKGRDFYPKEAPLIENNTNNVMVVYNHGSDENWEKNALQQQRKLKAAVIESTTNARQ